MCVEARENVRLACLDIKIKFTVIDASSRGLEMAGGGEHKVYMAGYIICGV